MGDFPAMPVLMARDKCLTLL